MLVRAFGRRPSERRKVKKVDFRRKSILEKKEEKEFVALYDYWCQAYIWVWSACRGEAR